MCGVCGCDNSDVMCVVTGGCLHISTFSMLVVYSCAGFPFRSQILPRCGGGCGWDGGGGEGKL